MEVIQRLLFDQVNGNARAAAAGVKPHRIGLGATAAAALKAQAALALVQPAACSHAGIDRTGCGRCQDCATSVQGRAPVPVPVPARRLAQLRVGQGAAA